MHAISQYYRYIFNAINLFSNNAGVKMFQTCKYLVMPHDNARAQSECFCRTERQSEPGYARRVPPAHSERRTATAAGWQLGTHKRMSSKCCTLCETIHKPTEVSASMKAGCKQVLVCPHKTCVPHSGRPRQNHSVYCHTAGLATHMRVCTNPYKCSLNNGVPGMVGIVENYGLRYC